MGWEGVRAVIASLDIEGLALLDETYRVGGNAQLLSRKAETLLGGGLDAYRAYIHIQSKGYFFSHLVYKRR